MNELTNERVSSMMENKYEYKKLDVYKEAKNLVKMVYKLIEQFPKVETYALCNQLRRAVISVPSNIAEGMSRYSDKEKVHFIEIAYGSLMEVESQLDISVELQYISQEQFFAITKDVNIVAKQLSALRSKYLPKT